MKRVQKNERLNEPHVEIDISKKVTVQTKTTKIEVEQKASVKKSTKKQEALKPKENKVAEDK